MIKNLLQLAVLGIFLLLGTTLKAESFSNADKNCLATVIYYEAGGEPIKGQYAIGEIIMNRLHAGFANSVCEVVNQKNNGHWQFGFNTKKHKGIPANRLNYFLMVAQKVIDREDNVKLPKNVLYFNSKPFNSKKYRLYCKIGHQLFFVMC
jgi:hypothetical protein